MKINGTTPLLVIAALAALSAPLRAQTVTTATLTGVVTDTAGGVLPNARVAVSGADGQTRAVRTNLEGRFRFRYLPADEYAVFAEKLGYRPERLTAVPLRAGGSLELVLTLEAAEPPVDSVAERSFAAPGLGYSRAGVSRWFGALETSGVPLEREAEASLGALATESDDALAVQGLPGAYTRYSLDGSQFEPLVHPHLPGDRPRSPAGLGLLRAAELLTSPVDVEWSGAAGGIVRSESRPGGAEYRARAWGFGGLDRAGDGFFSERVAGTFDVARAGAEVRGPLIPDTASFALGAEWRRVRTIQPQAWRIDEQAGAEVFAAAQDSGVDLRRYTVPAVTDADVASGYARFDWRVADGHQLTARADVTAYPAVSGTRETAYLPDPAPMPEGLDLSAGVALRSVLSERYGNQLLLTFNRSTRDYFLPDDDVVRSFLDDGVPQTGVVDGALLFGVDARAPAELARSAFRAEQALAVRLGSHDFKLGVDVGWKSTDWTYAWGRTGRFLFGGAAQFADRVGAYTRTTGPVPSASFTQIETAAFLEDVWSATPGLELVAGLRLSDERLPSDDIALDATWATLSGLRNDALDSHVRKFSPRVGFTWDVQQRHRWIVRGGFGLYHDDVGEDVLGELLTDDGALGAQRGLGSLGRWPQVPDSAAAPVQAPTLTLAGPDFQPPRSTRASFGISRVGATSLHLSTSYRHTDFLPVRRDLNLLPSAVYHDQYGRPFFGEPVKQGALLGVAPGTNRRFQAYDVVSGIEASGFSDYWDATALLERRVSDRVRLAFGYTYSRTRDNWLSHPGVAPEDGLAPMVGDSLGGRAWQEGVSDYDVPHRLSLAAELELPLPLAPSIGGVYRYRSGTPFTPGFRDGVDANGDYSWSNDPAFVDDALPGVDALIEANDCLRDQVGRFAERNVCRGPSRQTLDLRLGLEVVRTSGFTARLHADALNVLDVDLGTPDRALYLVDPDAGLIVDQADASFVVPLIANPDFGKPIRALSSGRVYRIGLEVTY